MSIPNGTPGRRLAGNIVALFSGAAARNLLQLAAVPYLARVLEPEGFGLLAMAQAYTVFAIIAVEYGFEYAGSRAVAQRRENDGELGELITGVLLTQFLLAIVAALAAVLVQAWVPALQDQPRLMVAAVAFAIAQGFSPVWYFNGQERLGRIMAILVAARIIATIGIFVLVKEPDDAWLVLVLYGSAAAVATVAGFALAWREIAFGTPSLMLLKRTLKLGFRMFVVRASMMAHNNGNALLLGILVSPQQVAFFVAGERLCRPVAWLMHPINVALLPRLSALLGYDPSKARRLASNALWLMGSTGLLIGGAFAVLAPWVVRLFYGDGFEEAVEVMRITALIVPLLVLNSALAGQWLIPNGLDRALNLVVLSGVALNLTLALLIVPQHGALGMAWVTVVVETFMFVGLLGALHQRRLAPWMTAPRPA